MPVPEKEKNVDREIMELENLPKQITTFMVSQKNFAGSYGLCFNEFKHYDLRNIQFDLNGKLLPLTRPFNADFPSGNFSFLYALNLLQSRQSNNTLADISMQNYQFGSAIYFCDLSQDMESLASDHTSEPVSGTLRINMDFAKPLPESIIIICLAEFDDSIFIDSHRNISIESFEKMKR